MSSLDTKFVFITGGGAASLGKGLISASVGLLLKSRGLRVAMLRFDPFLNVDKRMVDAGLHGEIFVTEDGGEVSFHLGDYERFLNDPQAAENYVTAGQIYHTVISKERRGGYGGHLVRLLPDAVDEVKSRIKKLAVSGKPDVMVAEIGGSTGDIDTLLFLEAARQLATEMNADNVVFIHVVLVPYVRVSKRFETKGACQTIRELRSWGIDPGVIVTRAESPLPGEYRQEIALMANVPPEAIFEAVDVESIYEVPWNLQRQGLDRLVARKIDLKTKEADCAEWNLFLQRMKSPFKTCDLAICGSTILQRNTCRSLIEALNHAAVANNIKLKIHWVDTNTVTSAEQIQSMLQTISGVVMVGDKAGASLDGEIGIIEYARTQQRPFVGIGLGCHAMLVEFARNVCGLRQADTEEVSEHSRVAVVQAVASAGRPGEASTFGPMRLGSCAVSFADGSLANQIYRKREATERFRHFYAFNPKYLRVYAKRGLVASGSSSRRKRFDFFELKNHPFFVGVQYHPEFRSTPLSPHPVFYHFLKKVIKYSENVPR